MKEFKDEWLGIIVILIVATLGMLWMFGIIEPKNDTGNYSNDEIAAETKSLREDVNFIAASHHKLKCETKGGFYQKETLIKDDIIFPPTCTIKGETYELHFGEWTSTNKLQ